MIAGASVVAEVLSDGDVVIYEPGAFDENDCAGFMDLWGPMDNRHFFLATLTLTPRQETPTT